jgi:hypothetical protein
MLWPGLRGRSVVEVGGGSHVGFVMSKEEKDGL